MLALNIAFNQRVLELQCNEAFPGFFLGRGKGARGVPCGRVGEVVVTDFSRTHKIVRRRDDFLSYGKPTAASPPVRPVVSEKILPINTELK